MKFVFDTRLSAYEFVFTFETFHEIFQLFSAFHMHKLFEVTEWHKCSARLALPAPEEANLINAAEIKADINQSVVVHQQPLTLTQESEPIESNQQLITVKSGGSNNEPIIEEPATPEPECPQISENDIEDTLYEDPDEIPTIKLNIEAFTKNVQNYMQENMELQEGSMSKALVVLSPEAALIPMPKLKNISRLRTEHQV